MGTPLMYAFREREKILDLFEAISGARMMCNFMRFGGLRCEAPAGWFEAVQKVVDEFPAFLEEFEALLSENEIIMARTQGVGVVSRELAVNASLTGPMLRASGVNYDLRKVDKYGIYDRFEFRDAAGRPRRRVRPLHAARARDARIHPIKILQQALKSVPGGPIIDPKAKLRGFRPKAGRSSMDASKAPRVNSGFISSATVRRTLPIPHPPAQLHQPDHPRGHVPRPDRRRHHHHPRQRGHCPRVRWTDERGEVASYRLQVAG